MNLDVRLPIGLMFSVFGVLLAVFGLVSDPQIYAEHSLGINVNLDWGLVLLLFGVTMLALALRARHARAKQPPNHG
jgi:putative Mn2+ efflux pump MntP